MCELGYIMGSTLGWFEVLVWDVSATHLGNEKWWMSKPNYDSVGFKGVKTCASTSFFWIKNEPNWYGWFMPESTRVYFTFIPSLVRMCFIDGTNVFLNCFSHSPKLLWMSNAIRATLRLPIIIPILVRMLQCLFDLIFINLYIRKSKFFKPNCSFFGY